MLVDAVLPAASELIMVYAGAFAAGAFTSGVVLFGHEFESGFGAWLAIVLAGTIGYTIGSVLGWAIGIYGGRPYLERHGRWLHLSPPKLAKAERWFDRWGDWAVFIGRITPVARSFVSIPAGVFRAPLGRYTVLHLHRLDDLVRRLRGDRLRLRHPLGDLPRELPLRGLRGRGRDRARRGVSAGAPSALQYPFPRADPAR